MKSSAYLALELTGVAELKYLHWKEACAPNQPDATYIYSVVPRHSVNLPCSAAGAGAAQRSCRGAAARRRARASTPAVPARLRLAAVGVQPPPRGLPRPAQPVPAARPAARPAASAGRRLLCTRSIACAARPVATEAGHMYRGLWAGRVTGRITACMQGGLCRNCGSRGCQMSYAACFVCQRLPTWPSKEA